MAQEKTEDAPREIKTNGQPPSSTAQSGTAQSGQPVQPQVRIDTSALKSSYCNVCNGKSTREGFSEEDDLPRDRIEQIGQHQAGHERQQDFA